jgi:hypothetical protein
MCRFGSTNSSGLRWAGSRDTCFSSTPFLCHREEASCVVVEVALQPRVREPASLGPFRCVSNTKRARPKL